MLTAQSQFTTQIKHWLEQLPIAIALFDRNMQYIQASLRWRELLDLGNQPLIGCCSTQTIPTLPTDWLTIYKNCLSGLTQSWQTECFGDQKKSSKSLKWQAIPWYDEAGKVGGITVSIEAVIEEKKVNQPPELQTFQQFKTLAGNVPGMIYQFRLDPDGTIRFPYISSGCCYIYELEPEQVYLQPDLLFEMVHPDDFPLLQNTIADSAKTLTKWETEWRIITPTGKQKWLKGISQPQYQSDGAILWDGCVIDISEHKATEAQRQQSQQLLQSVLDNIPQLIFWKDRNSVYQGCNQNFARVAGLNSPEEIIGKTDYDLAWTDEETNWYRHCDRQVMAAGQPELHIIETQQQADGRQAWIETNKIPLIDSQNQVIGILGTVEDISTRKQAEETLKRYNEELEIRVQERTAQLQQSLQELTNLKLAIDKSAIVSITDLQGSIIDVNDKFCQNCGYSRKELIGKKHTIINSGYHSPQFFQKMWRRISRGKVWQGEIKNKAKDGSYYWVDMTIVPLLNKKNQPYQYISISHNISDRKYAEIALQNSQNQLQAFINHSPAVIYLKNLEGEYAIANVECGRVLQASPGKVLGKTDYDLFPEVAASYIQHNDQKVRQTAQPLHSEEVIPLADGEHIYQTIKFPVADADGNIYAIGGISIDITNRKSAENALKQSEAHFQRLTANIPGMLYQYRLDGDGNFSFPYVSCGCRDLYGLEPEQIQQDASLLKIHPEDEVEVMAAVRLSAETLQDWKQEWRTILPSGEVKWVQGLSRPEPQADGSIIWDGCLTDISDRKRTEEQLHQFQQRLSLMVEQTPLGVIEWNTEMQVTAWNPSAERIFGYSATEAMGQYMNFILPESVRQQVQGINADLLMQQGGRYSINDNLRKDGQIIICEWYNTPLVTPEGEVIGIASHALDITERKIAELQLQQTTAELQEAQKLAHIGNWNYDIATGEIQWSKEMFRIYGLDDKTTVPSFEEVIALSHPEDREWFLKVVTEAANEGISYDVEVRMIRASGEIRHVNAKGEAVSNEQGQVIRLFGTLMDVTERKKAEAERQKLISIIEASSDFIGFATPEGQPIYVNPAGLKMAGLSSIEEAQTKPITDYYFPEDVQVFEHEILPKVLTQGMWQGESRLRQFKTNKLIPVDQNVFTVNDPETGELIGTAVISRDITERKKAEAERKKLISIVEASSDFIAFATLEKQLVYINPAGLKMVGLNNIEEAQTKQITDFYYPEEIQLLEDKILPEVLKKGTWQGELQFQHFQTGCLIPVDETIFILRDPETGEPMGIATVTRNISERKKAEAAFEKTTRDLQQAQRIAHIGNWEYDAATDCVTWSEELFHLFKRPVELGSPTTEESTLLYHPEDRLRLSQALENTVATAQPVELELRIGTDQDLRYVNVKAEVVQNQSGEVTGLFGTLMDITERKTAEIRLQQQAEILQKTLKELQRTQAQMIQSEKMSSLGQMVGGVAHEINNPVSFIHGNLTHADDYIQDLFELLDLYQAHYPEPPIEIQELLDEIELDFIKEDFEKLLKSMKIGTERIREIVLSLRNFSRLDEAEFKQVDIHQGIKSTLMILQNRLLGIEVITEYTELPQVECYPGQLNQVFMNLLDNAIYILENTPDHKTIRIQTDRIDSDWIRIKIANSGPEISNSICDKVFDPFFTTKPIGQGTGLGLSISYQIITDKHNGKINCYPLQGEGTEFSIEIPVRQTH
ncbi:MAG: PAS domain S-box protein [Microcoleaceae cyanobacterium]